MKKVEQPARVGLARYVGSSMRVEGAEVDVRLAGAKAEPAGLTKKQTALESVAARISLLGQRYRMLTDDVRAAADRLIGESGDEGKAVELGAGGGIVGDLNVSIDQLSAIADRLLGEIDRLKAAI